MRFVGIDLAWSPRNLSAGAVLSAEGNLLSASASLGTDQEILHFVEEWIPEGTPGIMGIDAPLSVPNERGGRPCDIQVSSVYGRFDAGPYLANRRYLRRFGGLRGETLTRRLAISDFRHDADIARHAPVRQIVEVFPHPSSVSLFDLDRSLKYKARRGRDHSLRWAELTRLRDLLVSLDTAEPPLHLPEEVAGIRIEGLRGRGFKAAEDLLDSIVCAYSVLYAWHLGPRYYAVYGTPPAVANSESGHILVPMTTAMWKRIKTPRLLILDRDGTINRSLGGRPPNQPGEVVLLPGVGPKLRHHVALGWRVVIVTNQAGVAYGYQSERQALAVHQAVLDALPVVVDASYLCPHHPEGTVAVYAVDCPNRKPAPGAMLTALDRFGARARDCLYVGDFETDRMAAEAGGVPFVRASEFFG